MAALTVDEILEKIGSFGRYQWFLLFAYGYAMVTIGTFPIMIVTFITAEPDWRCVKGYNLVCNFTEPITLTSPDYKARCDMPREAWTYVEEFTSTVTEYDLVCDRSHLQFIAQSCFWPGMMLGLIVGGFITDLFGRRRALYFGTAGTVIATWVMVFPKNFSVFIVCRAFIGFAAGFFNASGFVLLTEYTGKMHRAWMGIGSFLFWVFGSELIALLGYLFPNWRYFLLTTAALAIPCLVICWFLPESIRWLLLHGKVDQAREELVKVARINRKSFPDEDIKNPEERQSGRICDLFYSREITKRTLISWNIWFTVALVYYGVSYGSVDLGWNRYLSFALISLVEFPSNLVAIYCGDRFGRKICTATGLVFACIAAIISVSIPYEGTTKVGATTIIRIILAVLAKFSINLSFSLVYVWTVELFPTFIRGTALSTSSLWARIGSITASFTIWLIRVHPMLPFGIMGFFCFQSAVFSVFLPETNKQPTLEGMSDLVRRQEVLLSPRSQNQSSINNNRRDSSKVDGDLDDQLLV